MKLDETQPPPRTSWVSLAVCVAVLLLCVQDGLQFLDRVLKLEDRNQVKVELLTPSGQVGETVTVNKRFVNRGFRTLTIRQDNPRCETEWKGSYQITWPESQKFVISDVDKRKLWKAFWTFLGILFLYSNVRVKLIPPSRVP